MCQCRRAKWRIAKRVDFTAPFTPIAGQLTANHRNTTATSSVHAVRAFFYGADVSFIATWWLSWMFVTDILSNIPVCTVESVLFCLELFSRQLESLSDYGSIIDTQLLHVTSNSSQCAPLSPMWNHTVCGPVWDFDHIITLKQNYHGLAVLN